MKINLDTRWRIVTNNWYRYEVQYKKWFCFFWEKYECDDNIHKTLEEAIKYLEDIKEYEERKSKPRTVVYEEK